jgi:hypothetical protein
MSEIDEQLERQINRALDGELTPDERLELDRELLRRPEARRLMERYEQLDALAGTALQAVLGQASGATARACTRRPYARTWWLIPGAVAAALLATLLVVSPLTRTQRGMPAGNRGTPGNVRLPVVVDGQHGDTLGSGPLQSNAGMMSVNQRPDWTDRAIERGVYGVRGSDGKIYLLEINHTRSFEKPGDRSGVYPVSGDL